MTCIQNIFFELKLLYNCVDASPQSLHQFQNDFKQKVFEKKLKSHVVGSIPTHFPKVLVKCVFKIIVGVKTLIEL